MNRMTSKREGWEKRGIELPPGWHGAMLKLSELTGVSLKYLYTLAVDRLLADASIEGVEEAAWNIQRLARKELSELSQRHTAEQVEKRTEQGDQRGGKRPSRK